MMATATEPLRHSLVLHVGGLHYASEKACATRAAGAGARPRRRRDRSDQADGHGHGGHAGMSMAMVADLRNRFLVALVFAIPIAIWSPMGKSLLGSTPPTPFGMRTDL